MKYNLCFLSFQQCAGAAPGDDVLGELGRPAGAAERVHAGPAPVGPARQVLGAPLPGRVAGHVHDLLVLRWRERELRGQRQRGQ